MLPKRGLSWGVVFGVFLFSLVFLLQDIFLCLLSSSTNMLYLPSGLRLFRLPRQLGKLEFRIDFFFPLLYSYYKKSGSTPLPNELKIVDTNVLKG